MSSPGWYPDPAGDPNLLRYWDGSGWSSQTRPMEQPQQTGPSAWPELEQQQPEAWSSAPARPARRRTRLLLALGVAAVVVVGGGAAAALTLAGDDEPAPDGPTAAPAPSTTTTGPTSTAAPLVNDCPQADVKQPVKDPHDGRAHGGGLSFERQPGYKDFRSQYSFEFASEVRGESHNLKGSWIRLYLVGRLPAWSGYGSVRSAAESLVSCVANDSDMYPDLVKVQPVFSKRTTVDGHDGWSARAKVFVDGAPYPGGIVSVVTVDTGAPSYSMFLGDSPIGVGKDLSILDRVIATLRVDD